MMVVDLDAHATLGAVEGSWWPQMLACRTIAKFIMFLLGLDERLHLLIIVIKETRGCLHMLELFKAIELVDGFSNTLLPHRFC